MSDEGAHDAELAAIVAELERSGLLQTETMPDGGVRYRLTAEGVRVGRMLALSGDDEGLVLDALLGAERG